MGYKMPSNTQGGKPTPQRKKKKKTNTGTLCLPIGRFGLSFNFLNLKWPTILKSQSCDFYLFIYFLYLPRVSQISVKN